MCSRFDPDKHIIFREPCSVLTMKDLGFDDVGVSPVAVTHPFPLFSPEAIQIMRAEIAKPEVQRDYQFASSVTDVQLRGYARKHAPFTYAAWNHPQTVAIVSKLADIELVPWGDYEIAHVNLSAARDQGPGLSFSQDETPIVRWHTDSYPFVCVLMLSDCASMIGGETALRTATGGVIHVRGPSEGYAVVLQGRHVTHQALRPIGAQERITAVTSWRPRSPFVKDDSVLHTVRAVSDLNQLYFEYSSYRLEIVKQRVKRAQAEMLARRRDGKAFDTAGHKKFLQGVIRTLSSTDHELVPRGEARQSVAVVSTDR